MPTSVDIESILKFLLKIMEDTKLPKPEYAGITGAAANNYVMDVQRRFQARAEKAAFRLVNDQIVPADDSAEIPEKARAKKTATPATKERKMDDAEGEGGGGVGGTEEVGSAGGAAAV